MSETRKLNVVVTGDAKGAQRALGTVEKKAGGLKGAMSKLGGVMTAGLALGGVAAIGTIVKDAFQGAKEAEKINRILNSQIRNMGPIAAKSFVGASEFAQKLGNSIAKDDDDIKKIIGKLSSFPAAFGKGSMGADAMRRATAAAFDLEALGIGSAESNIIGIGKALDNPIKGMTALAKSGVSFTAEQKKQVEQYMKAGQLGKAQAVVMKGIETNAKGAAKAAASPMEKIKVALANVAEGIAGRILPAVEKFASWLAERALPAVLSLSDKLGPGLAKTFDILGVAVSKLFGALGNPVVQAVLAGILAIVSAMKIWTIVTTAYTAVQSALNVVMAMNPIGLVVLAIIALIAVIVILWKRNETFRKVLIATWNGIKVAVAAVVSWFKAYVVPYYQTMFQAIKVIFNALRAYFTTMFNLYRAVFSAALNWITSRWRASWTNVRTVFMAIVNAIRGTLNGLRSIVTSAISNVVSVVTGIRSRIVGFFAGAGSWLWNAGRNIISGLVNGITGMIGSLRDKLSSVTKLIPDWKGPETVDKVLLKPAGQMLMRGLITGIDTETPAVKSTLGALTADLALTANSSIGSPSGLALAAAPSGGTTIVHVTVMGHVTTEEKLADAISLKVRDRISRNGKRNRTTGV